MRAPLLLASLALFAAPSAAQTPDPKLWITDGKVLAMLHSGNKLYVGGQFGLVGPASGRNTGGAPLNRATGWVIPGSPTVTGKVYAAVPDGGGGWYIGGLFTQVGTIARSNTAHIRADGSVSRLWNPVANDEVDALAIIGTTLYLGGRFTTIGGVVRNHIAAVAVEAGNLRSWDPDANGPVFSITTGAPGSPPSVYVGGAFTSIGGKARNRIAMLDSTSGVATDWNPNSSGPVNALVASGTNIYVGGAFIMIGGKRRNDIAALSATSGTASAWNPDANGDVLTLAASGSLVYAGGLFSSIGGAGRVGIAALDASTGAATSWNPLSTGWVNAMAVVGNTIYAGGSMTPTDATYQRYLIALDATSGWIPDWDPSAGYVVRAVAVGGGSLYAGGDFTSINWVGRANAAAFDLTTGVATSWNPSPRVAVVVPRPRIADDESSVFALAVDGGRVYVGGNFNVVGEDTPRRNIAAVDTLDGLVDPWDPSANGGVGCLVISGNSVFVSGGFDSIGGLARQHLAQLRLSNGSATAWNPGTAGGINVMLLSGNTIYVGGGFSSIAGQPRSYIAALDATTGLATAWNPNATGGGVSGYGVATLVINGPTLYAGGSFGMIGGRARNNIAALDIASGDATSWDPNVDGTCCDVVDALKIQGGTIYAGGFFSTVGGQPRLNLAALDLATGAVTSWNPGTDHEVFVLESGPGQIFAAGQFDSSGGLPQSHLAEYNVNVVAVPGAPAGFELALGPVVPNPARSEALLQFTLPEPSTVTFSVYDIQGRRVASPLVRSPLAAGWHQINLRTRLWPAGCYVAVLQSGPCRLARKLVVVN